MQDDRKRAYDRLYYSRTKEKRRSAKARNVKVINERNKNFVYDYLSQRCCVECGEIDPVVLEFDHVRGSKVTDISNMVGRGFGLDAIKAELVKCDVVCANCHRRRTAKAFGHFRFLKAA